MTRITSSTVSLHPPDSDPDDYMAMAITEPAKPPQKETYTQRRIRKQREAEEKSQKPSSSAALQTALSTSLHQSSKGFRMLSKFGYTPGTKLGATNNQNGALEPLMIEMKEGKEGVGMANEKKRKFREEVEEKESEQREEQESYRERFGRERQERRTEGFLGSAMRLLEGLEEDSQRGNTKVERGTKKRVNILYRSLLRQRKEQVHERRIRYNLLQSLSKNAAYDGDADDEKQDRLAWGKEEEDSDEEDEELDAFEALDSLDRLQRLVQELREKHYYCFWCKHRYENKEMEGCPGVEEDDHD